MAIDTGSILSSIQSSLAAGKDPMEAEFGNTPTSDGISSGDEADPAEVTIEDGEGTGSPQEAGESSEESTPTVEDTTQESKPEDSVEIIKTKSGTEIKIDYSDRAAIKQDKLLALGARKWQAERDEAIAANQQWAAIEPDYRDAVEFRGAIKGAFEKNGLAGLVNLLTNDADGYKKFLAQELERERQYASASPEQRALLDEKRTNEQLKKELEADRKAREKQILDAEAKSKAAAEAEEQATVTAFQEISGASQKKFSFEGKLDNPDIEEALDNKVWAKVRADLETLPDETEISPRLMDKLFEKHAAAIQKGLKLKAENAAANVVKAKKEESQTKVAASAAAAMGKKTASQEFEEAGNKGDFASMLKMALGGKVKIK